MTTTRPWTDTRPRNPLAPPADDHWDLLAACQDEDRELFYPDTPNRVDQSVWDAPRAICDTCPVIAECLADALAHENGRASNRHGMFGGLTPAERAAIDPPKPRQAKVHGNIAGIRNHRTAGEDPCTECTVFYDEYRARGREYNRRKLEKRARRAVAA